MSDEVKLEPCPELVERVARAIREKLKELNADPPYHGNQLAIAAIEATRPTIVTGQLEGIPASIQNITPECRHNRTGGGAFEEAVSRIQQAYIAYHDAPDNKNVTWRISLVRVDPPAQPGPSK